MTLTEMLRNKKLGQEQSPTQALLTSETKDRLSHQTPPKFQTHLTLSFRRLLLPSLCLPRLQHMEIKMLFTILTRKFNILQDLFLLWGQRELMDSLPWRIWTKEVHIKILFVEEWEIWKTICIQILISLQVIMIWQPLLTPVTWI